MVTYGALVKKAGVVPLWRVALVKQVVSSAAASTNGYPWRLCIPTHRAIY
jgi:hypothetical protein